MSGSVRIWWPHVPIPCTVSRCRSSSLRSSWYSRNLLWSYLSSGLGCSMCRTPASLDGMAYTSTPVYRHCSPRYPSSPPHVPAKSLENTSLLPKRSELTSDMCRIAAAFIPKLHVHTTPESAKNGSSVTREGTSLNIGTGMTSGHSRWSRNPCFTSSRFPTAVRGDSVSRTAAYSLTRSVPGMQSPSMNTTASNPSVTAYEHARFLSGPAQNWSTPGLVCGRPRYSGVPITGTTVQPGTEANALRTSTMSIPSGRSSMTLTASGLVVWAAIACAILAAYCRCLYTRTVSSNFTADPIS